MAKQTHGSIVRHNVSAALLRLNGSPDTAAEWQTIARQLRRAADAARAIAVAADEMHETDRPGHRTPIGTRALRDAAYQSHESAR